jgi:hypothetical protein
MVMVGKQFGFAACAQATVKFASEFGERPVAGGSCRQRPAVERCPRGGWRVRRDGSRRQKVLSPGVLAGSPAQLSPSPGQLSDSPAHLADSPGQLSSSPGRFLGSPAHRTRSPGQLADSPAQLLGSSAHLVPSPGVLGRSPGHFGAPNAAEPAYFEEVKIF